MNEPSTSNTQDRQDTKLDKDIKSQETDHESALDDMKSELRIDSTAESRTSVRDFMGLAGFNLFVSLGSTTFEYFFDPYVVTLGAGTRELSVLNVIWFVFEAIPAWIGGKLSDKHGRKIFLFFGMLTLGITTFLTVYVSNIVQLFLLMIPMAIAGGVIWPAWDAFIGDITSEKFRAFFISTLELISTIVSILFITLYYFLFLGNGEDVDQYRVYFIIGGIFFILAAMFILLPRESLPTSLEKPRTTIFDKSQPIDLDFKAPTSLDSISFNNAWSHLKNDMRAILNEKKTRRYLILQLTFNLISGIAWPLYPVLLITYLQASIEDVIVIQSTGYFFMLLTQLFMRKYGDKFDRRVFIVGGIVFAGFGTILVGLAAFYQDQAILIYLIGGSIFKVGITGAFISVSAYALDIFPPEKRGLFSGMYFFYHDMSLIVASLIGGFLPWFLLNVTPVEELYIIVYIIVFVGVSRIIIGLLHLTLYPTKNPNKT